MKKCGYQILFVLTIIYEVIALACLMSTYNEVQNPLWNYNIFCLFCSIVVLGVCVMRRDEVPCIGLEVMIFTISIAMIVLGICLLDNTQSQILQRLVFGSLVYYTLIAVFGVSFIVISIYQWYIQRTATIPQPINQYGSFFFLAEDEASP